MDFGTFMQFRMQEEWLEFLLVMGILALFWFVMWLIKE